MYLDLEFAHSSPERHQVHACLVKLTNPKKPSDARKHGSAAKDGCLPGEFSLSSSRRPPTYVMPSMSVDVTNTSPRRLGLNSGVKEMCKRL